MSLELARARVHARGMSILVGTVDANGAPACCRGVGLVADPDLTKATVFVPLATSRDMIANAAATKRIAVMSSQVVDHTSYQLKGHIRALRLATDDEMMAVRANVMAFADLIIRIGMSPRVARSITYDPAFAIEFDVEEIYDQTPGPNAGRCVQ
jgi:hypothetical protein